MAIELERIKHKASSESGLRFTSLYHHMTNPELLYFCFEYEIKPGATPGIDGVTKKEYDESLEENIQDLSERQGNCPWYVFSNILLFLSYIDDSYILLPYQGGQGVDIAHSVGN